jgi:NADH dehydrogenase
MRKRKVLVLGGGFAGIYCARKLEKLAPAAVEISLVSRENFFVFTPMLPQVVSGAIESNHVVVPIRQIFKRVSFYEAGVSSIDVNNKRVTLDLPCDEKMVLGYDQLVVCRGSDTNFAKARHIESSVFALKSLKDALVLRNHIIDMLERADIEPDPEKRKQMLTFVIVGGGLSGVETAGELGSFFHEVAKYYPNATGGLDRSPAGVVLVHSRDRLLPELDSDLADFTLKELCKAGVAVRLNARVTDATEDCARISAGGKESAIPTRTIIWTAGISPNPAVACIPCGGESGRLPVDRFMRVSGYDDVWAVGDCAYVPGGPSGHYPPTAQHAIREAEVAAKNIVRSITGRPLQGFSYGGDRQMAVIGSRKAIARISGLKIQGFAAWWLWRAVYLQKIPMLKKKAQGNV